MKKIFFIYNPNSGKSRIKRFVNKITDIFEKSGNYVDIHATSGPLDAEYQVMNNANNYDLVVCAGGDGTLSEVVSGMMELEEKVPIGFIPVGSTNDTRRGFRLPKDVLAAARVCIEGQEFWTDVGKFNDEYFTYVASIGSLSAVSCFTPQDLKKVLGHGAYVIEGIKQLLKMDSFKMTIEFDGNVIEGEYILGMITNSMSVGGFAGIMGRDVDLQDGLFEVLMLKKPSDLWEFNREIDLTLIHREVDHAVLDDVVIKFRTNKVTFRSEKPVQWVRDGENGGKHKEAVIEVCNQAVAIMSPKEQ